MQHQQLQLMSQPVPLMLVINVYIYVIVTTVLEVTLLDQLVLMGIVDVLEMLTGILAHVLVGINIYIHTSFVQPIISCLI